MTMEKKRKVGENMGRNSPGKNRRDVISLVYAYIIYLIMLIMLIVMVIAKWESRQMDKNVDLDEGEECSKVVRKMRFDCHPENGASELSCIARRCCWDPPIAQHNEAYEEIQVPYCFYPQNWHLYQYERMNETSGEFEGELKNIASSFYKKDIQVVGMRATKIDRNILRVRLENRDNPRYEPIWPIINTYRKKSSNNDSDYEFHVNKMKPGFQVRRKWKKNLIFDSLSAGGFIFSDQFLQISTLLPSHNIYGLGEHRNSLKLDTNWQIFTLFNKDQPPTEHANLYGSHPFYMIVEESGACHGVLFLNSNAMDIILQPTPGLTFRSIGGIFDIFFFLGPTPHDVLRQYSSIIGKPFMPPYWSLGFHLCRLGYGSLEKTRQVWNRTRAADIPFDTQWNDLDYMKNSNDFTYDDDKFKGLPEFVQEIHGVGMHYIPLIDAGISASEGNNTYPPYDEGVHQDIFIKDFYTNAPFIGKVWNRVSTVWPDFTHPNISQYWYIMMNNMHGQFEYDGVWIDMNEPSNFYNGHINGCIQNTFDNPPYQPNVVGNLLATKTLCMNAKHFGGLHYNVHNTYCMGEAVANYRAIIKIRRRRPFIVSRATWIGQGHYSAHWTGDVYSSWHDLRMSIPEILQFSLFQIPMVGADICGFDGNTTVELCNRWMQVGAFYPFSRNHNSDDTIEQDPVALGDLVIESSKKALMIKYRLLPYLYTLFFMAHSSGSPVLNPLFFLYWEDKNTLDIDRQFLWGKGLMIVPVLEQGKTEVKAYLPKGIWYNYYNNTGIISTGQWFVLEAPLDTIPLFIRDGIIIPAQAPSQTTAQSRKNKFELIITISHPSNENPSGSLFWDDGDSIDSINTHNYLYENFEGKLKFWDWRGVLKMLLSMDRKLIHLRTMNLRNIFLSQICTLI
ncbi:lysosomal alpha-glucosidase isoform X2 [Fopius arisanus]|uniref:Lysosomal alpha-glucosidase isoform X2 n=1 Tax=Fopius arisanus TaxID=64838 RepID=A0A9R1SY29_9HYME|nr:PREDICTED: lysosomal alpha-glucosidase-like isoform X2 [Fopius arisanus]